MTQHSSHFTVLYVLILGVVVALLLSFLQLRDSAQPRVFAPKPYIVSYPSGSPSLDHLTYTLTRDYHVLALYQCEKDDPDALFQTVYCVKGAGKVTVPHQTELLLEASGCVTVPRHLPVMLDETLETVSYWWKMHPFPRPRKVSQLEQTSIFKQWRKVKRCRVVTR